MGLRSNDTRAEKRKPDEVHQRNRVQSHEAFSADRGKHRLGLAMGPDFMEANQMGSFNVGIATVQAQSVLVKSKKDLARSRAIITLDRAVEGPRSS